MNTLIITANVLVVLTFFAYTFGRDREYQEVEPESQNGGDGSDDVCR